MLRLNAWFLCFFVAAIAAPVTLAQSTCKKVDGKEVCTIQLQPNNMEPIAEPSRIRVDDRSRVVLRLENLSPLDSCALGPRTSTPISETNPFESIVTTIGGLGGVGLSASTVQMSMVELNQVATGESQTHASRTPAERAAHPNPLVDDPKYKLFWDGAGNFSRSAQDVLNGQKGAQTALEIDVTTLSNYVSANYRGGNWTAFHPSDDHELDAVRLHINNPLVSIIDAAPSQAWLTEMNSWAGDLHKSYDSKTDVEIVDGLKKIDLTLARSNATISMISDYNSALKTAQTNLRTSFNAAVKLYNDFQNLINRRIIQTSSVLFQDFSLGTDRKTTVTGYLSCVSSVDGKTPTTDQINYLILYQDVPVLSASAGFLTTFQEKRVIGTTTTSANNSAGFNTIFAVTDSARAQIFPMAFFNLRLANHETHWYKRPEDELNFTTHLSAGIGVNPNTGTNQPEFFFGMAFGLNKLMIHPGVHFGRTQSLGGGFTLNSVVPAGYAGPVPINWSYHPAFSIGFSVRVAPW